MSHTPKEFSYVAQDIFDSFNVSDFHLDLIYNGDNNRLFHMYLSRGSGNPH